MIAVSAIVYLFVVRWLTDWSDNLVGLSFLGFVIAGTAVTIYYRLRRYRRQAILRGAFALYAAFDLTKNDPDLAAALERDEVGTDRFGALVRSTFARHRSSLIKHVTPHETHSRSRLS